MTRTKYNNLIKVSRKNITDKYIYFLKVLKLRKELKSIPLSAIYMYIHTHMCVCVYVNIYVIYIYAHIYMYVFIYLYKLYMYTYTYMCI